MKMNGTGIIDITRTLIRQVQYFQSHPHEVVQILLKGFSRVMLREAFVRPVSSPRMV